MNLARKNIKNNMKKYHIFGRLDFLLLELEASEAWKAFIKD
jgi:hypothetical protein